MWLYVLLRSYLIRWQLTTYLVRCALSTYLQKKRIGRDLLEMNSLAPYRLYMTTTTLINYILVNTFIPFPLISRWPFIFISPRFNKYNSASFWIAVLLIPVTADNIWREQLPRSWRICNNSTSRLDNPIGLMSSIPHIFFQSVKLYVFWLLLSQYNIISLVRITAERALPLVVSAISDNTPSPNEISYATSSMICPNSSTEYGRKSTIVSLSLNGGNNLSISVVANIKHCLVKSNAKICSAWWNSL